MKEQYSSHLRKIGVCLYQFWNWKNENMLSIPVRHCIWSAKGLEWSWNGYFHEIVQSDDSHNLQWRSADSWRGNSYVKELDTFLIVKVFENTPAVLSFGKLCDENGFFYEWTNGTRIPCTTENFVPIVVPGSSNSSCGSDSAVSRTLSRQGSHCSTSSSSSSSSPTVSEIRTREREDRTESDISPVTVSTTVDERPGRPDIDQGNQNRTNKRNPRGNRATCCLPTQVVQALKPRSGSKNSENIWWMMKFQIMETLTPIRLMMFL